MASTNSGIQPPPSPKDRLDRIRVNSPTVSADDFPPATLTAEKSRTRFLAVLSHDLRNPLHGIISYASFGLKKTEMDPPPIDKLHHYFSSIKEAGQRLQAMLDDLLEVAKLDAGQVQFSKKERDLVKITQSVINEIQARTTNPLCELIAPPEPLLLSLDVKTITQAIRRLISNSLARTEAHGRVTIRLENDVIHPNPNLTLPAVRFTLEDPQWSLDEKQLAFLFDLLNNEAQSDPTLRDSGLKIEICRLIVAAHGGRLWGEAMESGGTRFVFLLPK